MAGVLDVDPSTVLRVRRQCVAEGLDVTLERKRPDCVYERTLDGKGEVTPPRSPAPGQPAQLDPESVSGGVANLFLVTEPLRGLRSAAGQSAVHPARLRPLRQEPG